MPQGQGFNWEDEDVMASGFESEPEEEAPAEPASRPAYKPKPQPVAVESALDEIEESPDPAELSEAEWRLEKATFYRSVINSQLLRSDHPAAIEVEQELQEWATLKLHELLGIKTIPVKEVQVVKAELPFNEEQVQALTALANKVIEKQKSSPALPAGGSLPLQPAKPQPVVPAITKPQPKIRPIVPGPDLTTMKRGRGRPPKPCRICGELVCEHKKKPSTPQASPQPGVPSQPLPPKKLAASAPVSGETYDGIPIQVTPDGTKFIDTANGRRYKLEVRTFTHKETKEQRQAYVPVEWTLPQPKSPLAKPYPSDVEAMALATAEAGQNLNAVSQMQAMTAVGGAPQRITGKNLIDAAMAAEEREAYIPEPPPGKKR